MYFTDTTYKGARVGRGCGCRLGCVLGSDLGCGSDYVLGSRPSLDLIAARLA